MDPKIDYSQEPTTLVAFSLEEAADGVVMHTAVVAERVDDDRRVGNLLRNIGPLVIEHPHRFQVRHDPRKILEVTPVGVEVLRGFIDQV